MESFVASFLIEAISEAKLEESLVAKKEGVNTQASFSIFHFSSSEIFEAISVETELQRATRR